MISISEEAWSSVNIIKTLKNNKGNVFNLMKDMYQNLKQTFNGKTSDACYLRSGTRQTWLTLLGTPVTWNALTSMLRK